MFCRYARSISRVKGRLGEVEQQEVELYCETGLRWPRIRVSRAGGCEQ